MYKRSLRAAGIAGVVMLGHATTGCSQIPDNTSLYSVHQPVVERSVLTLDLTTAGGGLSPAGQRRLADWFGSLDLGYGDRIAMMNPTGSEQLRADVAAIAGRYGIRFSEAPPTADSPIEPGNVRILVARSRAFVPGCPDWSDKNAATLGNATSSNYGCAVNGNLAAMVADPEHLLHGANGTGETMVMSASKAIRSWRDQEPSGAGGLAEVSTRESEE